MTGFTEAIDLAVAQAMAADERVLLFGEDVPLLHPALFSRFGPQRVMAAPISEAAFVGAAGGAAMLGLRPVAEVMLVDFLAVAMDAVLNHIAKVASFSGGSFSCPLVIRAACGGGYGDGGQHEQCLWGLLGGIPGLRVVVPSRPADAAGLMLAAIESDEPVVFLEHKLLSAEWLDFMGRGGRDTVSFDVPPSGADGEVPRPITPLSLDRAEVRRRGEDLTLVALGVGLYRALEAAARLESQGVSCEVLDLRCVRPLDVATVVNSVAKTGRLLVVDEDYRESGLSGEVAAVLLERDLPLRFRRVCLEGTLPYARALEDAALPNVERLLVAAGELLD